MTNPKRVMILGASRYQARAVIAAREMGCEVLATDRNPDAYAFAYADYAEPVDISDIEASIATARRYKVDGVVPLNDFGVPTAAAVSEALGLPGISCEAATYATSKAWMRRKWAEAGVPSARFGVAESVAEACAVADRLDTWPLIVKPADSRGGGSRGVSIVRDVGQLPEAVHFAQSFYENQSVVIEEFLEGVEHSMEVLIYQDEVHVLAVSDKEKTPPPYRVDRSVIYPTMFTGESLARIHEVAAAAVRALGIDRGAAHVEMCTTADGPHMFELGARCGGGGTPDPIVPFVSGIEMVKEVVRLALGETPRQLEPLYARGCVYRFVMPAPGRVARVRGLEDIRTWDNILDCEMFAGVGDEIRPVRVGGDRAGFIIAGGETRAEAVALADRAEAHIQIDYVN